MACLDGYNSQTKSKTLHMLPDLPAFLLRIGLTRATVIKCSVIEYFLHVNDRLLKHQHNQTHKQSFTIKVKSIELHVYTVSLEKH